MASLRFPPPQDELHKAASLLSAAKRPAIIVGHGARFDMTAVRALVRGLLRVFGVKTDPGSQILVFGPVAG